MREGERLENIGEMKRYGREKGWRNVNVKLKKIIRKWKEKR